MSYKIQTNHWLPPVRCATQGPQEQMARTVRSGRRSISVVHDRYASARCFIAVTFTVCVASSIKYRTR
jgi:hypothetical protein